MDESGWYYSGSRRMFLSVFIFDQPFSFSSFRLACDLYKNVFPVFICKHERFFIFFVFIDDTGMV